jgi:biotin transport system substrate-specific component
MQSTFPIHLGTAQDSSRFAQTRTGKAVLTVGATILMAVCAHISLPLFFTPVPLTLQTLAVIFIGLTLGPMLGFSAMVLYLAEGAVGMPVFSPHGGLGGVAQLLGPTGGYLFSYPLAAAATGAVAGAFRRGNSRFAPALLAGAVATLVIFTMGAGWLAHLMHLTSVSAWHLAVAPFLPGEVIKVIAAASLFSTLARGTRSQSF